MCVLATVYSGRLAQISDLVEEGSCEVGVESNLYQIFIAVIVLHFGVKMVAEML